MKQNNYLVHYGVKGMKWKNHIYKSIVGGEYIYSTEDITNRAAEMKKEGYSHDEIKAQIRSEMAEQRSSAMASGGAAKDYSGAKDRAKEKIQNEGKTENTNSSKPSSDKYESELNKAKQIAKYEAEKSEKTLEEKHAQYDKEKAERKAQKEADRKAQEEREAAEAAEKEAKKKKKGSGSSGKKGSSKKGSSKKNDKTKENEEIQKKIDQGVKEALAKMGLSAEYMNSDSSKKLPEEQIESLANSVIRGELGNGTQRKAALGNQYAEVQKLVNQKLTAKRSGLVSKGAEKPEKQKEVKYGASKRVKHSMESSTYIKHSGVFGMHWGIRRYQNEDGSLTDLGREHYGIGKRKYQNPDGTLTEAGIKKYTKLDRKTGARTLNRQGEKFYKKQVKSTVKTIRNAKKDLVKNRDMLTDEELEKLTKRLENEKKLSDTYSDSTVSGRIKKELTGKLVKKGADAAADIAVNAALSLGSRAIEKALNSKLKDTDVSKFTNELNFKKADQEFKLHMHDTKVKYDNAQEAVKNAEKAYNETKKKKDSNLESYSNAVEKAKAALKDAKKTYDNEEIKQNYVRGLAKLNEQISAKNEMDKYIKSNKENNRNFASNLIKQRDKK